MSLLVQEGWQGQPETILVNQEAQLWLLLEVLLCKLWEGMEELVMVQVYREVELPLLEDLPSFTVISKMAKIVQVPMVEGHFSEVVAIPVRSCLISEFPECMEVEVQVNEMVRVVLLQMVGMDMLK